LDTPVGESDEISILPAVAGGALALDESSMLGPSSHG
jgi:hypothetical protein